MALRMSGVSCSYGENDAWRAAAVQDIDLTVERGEIVGVVGHTGSGKSTLAQLICGLLSADSGEIWLGDMCLTGRKAPRATELIRRAGMVFQYPEHQLFAETVAEEIAYGPENLGRSEDETEQDVRRIAEELGISEAMLAASPYQLSGGEKRKVALASVLILRPTVLVLDEPFVGLDAVARREFIERLLKWRAENNSTILCISHDIDQLAAFCHRLLVLQQGHLKLDMPVRQAFSQVELLRECGVNLPLARRAVLEFAARGGQVATDALTLEEAAAAIRAALPKGGAANG